MCVAPEDWKKITLLMRPDLVTLVDEWRRRQADLPDRNEALRRLVTKGLSAEGISEP